MRVLLSMALVFLCTLTTAAVADEAVRHDEEHYVLLSQHADAWGRDDQAVDAKLAEIRAKNGGKRPNIIYILIDDIGFGELGSRRLNYYNGYDTPNINNLASEGMSLMRMYSESVCTPTRVAFQTGRYPVRAGVTDTKVSVAGSGLSGDEVTIAEVLSGAGYNTVHIGKWHLGDIEQSWPHNQGFDYAEFPIHQQGQLALMHKDAEDAGIVAGGIETPTEGRHFSLDKTFRLNPAHQVTGVVASRGGKATEVDLKPGEQWSEQKYREMNLRYQASMMRELDKLAADDAPFFLEYWPLYPLTFTRSGKEFKSRNGGTVAESMQEVDSWIGAITARVDALGIAENTLIVLMGDNGPFLQFMDVTGQAQRLYRGGKGDHLEGGIRVDAFARWTGVIDAGSFVGDMTYVADLFTTFARIAGAEEYIPRDRIIDGVDQSSLLLLGEQHGRRDYLFVYEGPHLRSVIKEHFKMHLPGPGELPLTARVFDLLRDPREEKGQDPARSFRNTIWTANKFVEMVKGHMLVRNHYPNRQTTYGVPYQGITNLRPETIALRDAFMARRARQMGYIQKSPGGAN